MVDSLLFSKHKIKTKILYHILLSLITFKNLRQNSFLNKIKTYFKTNFIFVYITRLFFQFKLKIKTTGIILYRILFEHFLFAVLSTI